MANLGGKTILLGVTGGIAAYKALELMRAFTKAGAVVKVVLTRNASRFVPPLTWETLSRQSVITNLFAEKPLTHLTLLENVDLMVIAPATANCLAKLCHGIADDALSTLALAFQGPLLVAPAMNEKMYFDSATQSNLAELAKRQGVHLAEPERGPLACQENGVGRLAAINKIYQLGIELIKKSRELTGLKILLTAGPTREIIDPVRFISNRSSGRMGYALSGCASRRGAQVTLISGPVTLPPPGNVNLIKVTTANEMLGATLEHFNDADILIMSAAVADYRVGKPVNSKIKKENEALTLTLVKNPDILMEVSKRKTNQLLVGFALESENLIAGARKKLKKKNLDFIVANEPASIAGEQSKVVLIDKKNEIVELPLMEKTALSGYILDKVKRLWEEK